MSLFEQPSLDDHEKEIIESWRHVIASLPDGFSDDFELLYVALPVTRQLLRSEGIDRTDLANHVAGVAMRAVTDYVAVRLRRVL